MKEILFEHHSITNALDSITYTCLRQLLDKFQLQFNCKIIHNNPKITVRFESEEDLFLFLMEWS